MFSAPPPWNNVVQGKLPGLLTAILADVMVAIKYLEPAQFLLMAGTFNHVDEPDYRRYLEYETGRVKLTPVILQHFGFAPKNQYYGPTCAAQIERLITLVKH
jgi:hypothetical protein